MSEQHWYIYQQNQQIGPFDDDQLKQMVESKLVATDAYLFRVGWKDWRPLEDCYDEVKIAKSSSALGGATPQRRAGAPRASIQGRVIVHNNNQLVIGLGVNISTTGIFVETRDEIFTLGEKLKLSVRCDGIKNPFNVNVQVIRFNGDNRFPVGYGLKFENLEARIRDEIESLVKLQNQDYLAHSRSS